MKKKIIILISLIILIIFAIVIGILVSVNKENENDKDDNQEVVSRQKIVVATIIIENEDRGIESKNSEIDDPMFNTYQALINSAMIKNKVKEKYPEVDDIELEKIKDSDLVKVIFVCDKYSEEECIEIENMFLKEFSERIPELYDVKIYIVDEPAIIWRNINL